MKIQASTYPHASKESQNKMYKHLRSATLIEDEANSKEVTIKDLGKILASTSNG